MIRIIKSIEIETPPTIIWNIIAKHLEHPNISETSTSTRIRAAGGKPLTTNRTGVGVRTRWSYEFMGRTFTWDDEVTDWDEGRFVAWRALTAWTMVDSFELKPTTKGTELVYRIEYKFPYGLVGWVVARIRYHRHIERSLEKTLKDLKQNAEKIRDLSVRKGSIKKA